MQRVLGSLWKIPLIALAFATMLVISRIVLTLAGAQPPRMPAQAPEEIAGYYLLVGSVILAAGLAPVAGGLCGRFGHRWLLLASFCFVGFGVNATLESAIFSNSEGTMRMVPVLAVPCLVLTGVLAALFRPEPSRDASNLSVARLLSSRRAVSWAWRFPSAVATFPAAYLTFGILVSPIVGRYYRDGVAGLSLPDVRIIILVQFIRSTLSVLATFLILAHWHGSRGRLVLSLAIAYSVFVVSYDFVLAYQVPVVLLITHGVEIAADSLVFAWGNVTLLGRGPVRAVNPATCVQV